MTSELREIKIKDGDFLPFVNRTNNLGRAEFVICPIFKRRKLVKLFIFPLQQEVRDFYYVWEGHPKRCWYLSSYEDCADPKVWRMFYCKEHKCQSSELYVPAQANYIWISEFNDNLTIGFTKTDFSKKK